MNPGANTGVVGPTTATITTVGQESAQQRKPFTRQQRLEAAKFAMQGILAYHGLSKDVKEIMKRSVELGDLLLSTIEDSEGGVK